ncbi:ABC transporter permease [Neolewinella xylanilytica]|nr:ABC transporter permease [Neolewinella xylanilytica]
MLTSVRTAFAEAFQNLRNNFFQTFLSVLGIIIGVAALVAMLAIIDGLEKLAREGIAANSSMESVLVRARTSRRIDGVVVPMRETADLRRDLIDSMLLAMPYPAAGQSYLAGATMVQRLDTSEALAVRYTAASLPFAEEAPTPTYGRQLEAADDRPSGGSVVINHVLARRLVTGSDSLSAALGQSIGILGGEVEVVGIYPAEAGDERMEAILPLRVVENLPEQQTSPLLAIVNFDRVEDIAPGRDFMLEWLGERFAHIEDPVEAVANLDLVKQLELGFTVFRLVMSFLIGIAVVVGGVGVMNVLLMSITERTPEIGIRKAVGADPRRILAQFLSESVAISTLGSLIGLAVGSLAAVAIAAVISLWLETDFEAVFRLRTLAIVFGVAVVTGIVFGTYPARRAARLDPVAAIHRS